MAACRSGNVSVGTHPSAIKAFSVVAKESGACFFSASMVSCSSARSRKPAASSFTAASSDSTSSRLFRRVLAFAFQLRDVLARAGVRIRYLQQCDVDADERVLQDALVGPVGGARESRRYRSRRTPRTHRSRPRRRASPRPRPASPRRRRLRASRSRRRAEIELDAKIRERLHSVDLLPVADLRFEVVAPVVEIVDAVAHVGKPLRAPRRRARAALSASSSSTSRMLSSERTVTSRSLTLSAPSSDSPGEKPS